MTWTHATLYINHGVRGSMLLVSVASACDDGSTRAHAQAAAVLAARSLDGVPDHVLQFKVAHDEPPTSPVTWERQLPSTALDGLDCRPDKASMLPAVQLCTERQTEAHSTEPPAQDPRRMNVLLHWK